MPYAVAIAMQVIGSFLFASGAILQSLGVRSTFDPNARASSNKLTLAGLLRLFLIRTWLFGLVFVLAGAFLHLWALSFAPVTLVQPVGILAVPWSVLLAAKIHKHALTRHLFIAVAVTIVGVLGFTVITATHAVTAQPFGFPPLLISFFVVCLLCVGLSVVASRAAPWAKAMCWSSVGAIFYGLASGLMKAGIDLIQHHGEGFLGWQFIVVVTMTLACFGLGVWMIQQGYASGPAEITVGTMTTVDPVVAVLFGLLVLGEGSRLGVLPAIGMVFTGAIAIWGVVLLSKDHPEAVAEREKHEELANVT